MENLKNQQVETALSNEQRIQQCSEVALAMVVEILTRRQHPGNRDCLIRLSPGVNVIYDAIAVQLALGKQVANDSQQSKLVLPAGGIDAPIS